MRRIFIRLLFGISLTVTILAAVHLVIFDGYKDVTLGRMHRKAHDLFSETEDVYQVKIHLIMGTGKSDGKFPTHTSEREHPTYGSVTLTAEQLEKFKELWQCQEASWGRSAMCHEPVYGFQLFRKGKLTRETSICWKCSNFSVNVYPEMTTFYGFNAESEQARELLAFCDKLLPYRRLKPI